MDLDVWGTLSFRRLAHFVAAVEAGTISGAAERLFMSQSALAGSISELERTLDADLLIRRRGRGVSLTPTGAEVLEVATLAARRRVPAQRPRSPHGPELVGPLAVGCFPDARADRPPASARGVRAAAPEGDDHLRRGRRRTPSRSGCWPASSTWPSSTTWT